MSLLKNKLSCLFLILALALVSCDIEPTTTDTKQNTIAIAGYWASEFDGFEVTDTTFTYYYISGTKKTLIWKGTIIKSLTHDATSGALIIKVTETVDDSTSTNDKYTVVQWKNFTLNSVEMSMPYKEGKECNGLETAKKSRRRIHYRKWLLQHIPSIRKKINPHVSYRQADFFIKEIS